MMKSRKCRTVRLWITASLFLFSLGGEAAMAAQKDLVIMTNGDRLTGKVTKLENGVLYMDLEYVSGSIGLDWKRVEKVQTERIYQVLLQNGDRLVGSLERKSAPEIGGNDVAIISPNRRVRVMASDVVQVEQEKESVWRQLTGSIGFGTSFTSGNKQRAFNTDATVNYPTRTWSAGASLTSSYSGESGASQTNLEEVQAGVERYLNRDSFLLGLSDFLHSSQQELELRTTLGGGYGRYLVRTDKSYFRWFAGGVYTDEHFESATSQPRQENGEALIGSQYERNIFYRYTLQSQLLIYPGLSDFGRLRMTTKSALNVKLSNNFSLSFSFWDNFDSRPPITAKKNELGLNASVGWRF